MEDETNTGAETGAGNAQETETKPTAKESDDKGTSEHERAIAKLKSEIAKKNERAKELESKLSLYEKEKTDAETKKLEDNKEFEKLSKKFQSEAETYKNKLIRAELKLHAQKEGIVDPSDVDSIALDDVSFNDKGEVIGAEKAVKALRDSKPHWFKSAVDGGESGAGTKETAKPAEKKSTGTSKVEPPKSKTPPPTNVADMDRKQFAQAEKDFLASLKRK